MNEERNISFFEFLSDEERAEFEEVSEFAIFAPGEALISEGESPDCLFILSSGKVEVHKRVPGRGERLLAVFDAANERTLVGERGLLCDNRAAATVRAREEVEAVAIPRETFRAMIQDGRPAAYKLAYRIARILAKRLTRLDEEVVETVRELERRGETDLDVFREKLVADWTM